MVYIHNLNNDSSPSDVLNLNMMVEIVGKDYRDRLNLVLNKYTSNARDSRPITRHWGDLVGGRSPIIYDSHEVPPRVIRNILAHGDGVATQILTEFFEHGKIHKTTAGRRISDGYDQAIKEINSCIQGLERDKDQLGFRLGETAVEKVVRKTKKKKIEDEIKEKKGQMSTLVANQKNWRKT